MAREAVRAHAYQVRARNYRRALYRSALCVCVCVCVCFGCVYSFRPLNSTLTRLNEILTRLRPCAPSVPSTGLSPPREPLDTSLKPALEPASGARYVLKLALKLARIASLI